MYVQIYTYVCRFISLSPLFYKWGVLRIIHKESAKHLTLANITDYNFKRHYFFTLLITQRIVLNVLHFLKDT